MRSDDPRHGTPAGHSQHRRDGEESCLACSRSDRRARKALQLDHLNGLPRRVPLGEDAWRIICSRPIASAARDAGVSASRLQTLKGEGPEKYVLRVTRDRILSIGATPTPIGVQRRLRALSAIGWSMARLAHETGVYSDNLINLLNRDPKFVKPHVASAVVASYERLHMHPPAASRSATRARSLALRKGWAAPLAWDDIDDPNERPKVPRVHDKERPRNLVDPVVVQRVLSGEKLPTSRAEKAEIVRRWVEGGGSQRSICQQLGLREGRYMESQVAS